MTGITGGRLTLLGVWAHPDDEAYLSAGLMGRVSDRGGRAGCVTATRGESGTSDPHLWTPERLSQLRERELRASLAEVGAHSLEVWSYADGECNDAGDAGPINRLVDILETHQPDLVVTFGSDGITGHPDHVAVSRWVTAAWLTTGRGILLYPALTAEDLFLYRELDAELGVFMGPEPEPTALAELALSVNLRGTELRRKRRALARHASQTEAVAAMIGERRYRSWWRREHFRRPRMAELAVAAELAAAASSPARRGAVPVESRPEARS